MSAPDGARSGGKAGSVAEDASAAEATKAAMVRAEAMLAVALVRVASRDRWSPIRSSEGWKCGVPPERVSEYG